jgi:hypothetical protein
MVALRPGSRRTEPTDKKGWLPTMHRQSLEHVRCETREDGVSKIDSIPPVGVNVLSVFPLACFQLTLIGRFWVTS